jgi:thiamine biosynthesis lipoprotein
VNTSVARATHREIEHVMGMPISLALRGRHAGDHHGRAAWAETLAALRDVDRVFSTYRDDSWISRLDRGEVALADCPPEVAEVLALGEAARAQSHGAFDVRATGRLDPSGVVKGWAVERAARALRHLDDTDFCLSAGGDMVCHLTDPDRPAWRVGIEDPHRPDRVVGVVQVTRGAVATSGLRHRGDHVVHGRTGAPPTLAASVTVICEDLLWADLDATAALALDREASRWLSGRPGRQGLVVWTDGTISQVPGGHCQQQRLATRPRRPF